jgi:tetratricopeptide (TPR) repeat protein
MENPLLDLLRRAVDLENAGNISSAIEILNGGLEAIEWSAERREVPTLTGHLVILCERANNPELGIKYLRKCLANFPSDLGTLYTLARLLQSTGLRLEALEMADRFRRSCVSSTDPLKHACADLIAPLDASLLEKPTT